MQYRKQLASHAKRRAAILKRHEKGDSYTDIAKDEGISPARVGQIVRSEKDKKEKKA
jgi:DNA-directed RNA polymerase specialized sigma24 family protein